MRYPIDVPLVLQDSFTMTLPFGAGAASMVGIAVTGCLRPGHILSINLSSGIAPKSEVSFIHASNAAFILLRMC